MMVKKIMTGLAALFVCSALSAYNPPAGGQNLLRISSPDSLTGAGSSAGGALYNVTPSSVVNNPALPAFEQRIELGVSGTMLFDNDDESEKSLGGAFETGLLLPSRWCVGTFLVQGVWVPYFDMPLGNSFTFTANVSKDINDHLAIGLGGDIGIFYGYDSDWTGGFNTGALYRLDDFFFMKDARFSFSLLNLGKPLKHTAVKGINGEQAEKWPAVGTLRMGFGATLLDVKTFTAGACVDFVVPGFQNFVFDAGLNFVFFDLIKLSAAWEFDVREYANGAKNLMPSVGISAKFIFNSKEGSMLASKGWQQSEIALSGAWKQLYKNVNAVSVGAVLNLGLQDTQAPEILLWGGDE